MRKRIVGENAGEQPAAWTQWMDLEPIAQVEVTSEHPSYPIERALSQSAGPGWRAATPGEQTIRLLFDRPVRLRRVRLSFYEGQHARTQEFVLHWSADGGRSYREIVRQQYNFSPPGTTNQLEEYSVDLNGVTALELRIIPDLGGGGAGASLESLYLA